MKPLSVSELTRQIKDLMEPQFSEVYVEGEVSNLKISSSKHIFFNLIDAKSILKAVIFKFNADGLKREITNGQKVLVSGRISVYEPYGEYRLIVSYILNIGDGMKYKKFEEDKKFLLEKGYLDNKKTLPLFPKKIIIITSSKGAAIQDILNILKRRITGLEIFIYPVSVQGENAKNEILKAISFVNSHSKELSLDVCILSRGGGSIDDLWLFNDLELAIAYKNCQIPTISAIGHQIDQTLCDLVADKAAETPSTAAEILTKTHEELFNNFLFIRKSLISNFKKLIAQKNYLYNGIWSKKIVQLILHYLEVLALKLDNNKSKLEFSISSILSIKNAQMSILEEKIKNQNPILRVAIQKNKNIYLQSLVLSNFKNLMIHKKHKLSDLENTIIALNPQNILKRGYSITFDKNNNVIKDISSINENDYIYTKLARGSILSIISKKSQ